MQLLLRGNPALFIHVPKTGGNSLQQAFLQLGWTDDQPVLNGHQDGVDRFELSGVYTYSKHQPLGHYQRRWPAGCRVPVFACLRQPLQRLVSLYFSPHRWLRPSGVAGAWHFSPTASFDAEAFAALIAASPSAVNLLADGLPPATPVQRLAQLHSVQQLLATGQLQLLRTDRLAADFQRLFGCVLPVEARNVSPYREQARRAAADPEVGALVAASHHQLDQQLWDAVWG